MVKKEEEEGEQEDEVNQTHLLISGRKKQLNSQKVGRVLAKITCTSHSCTSKK